MAAILTIIGGILGFASALATLVIAQAGILVAFAVWIGIGISFLVLGVLTALLPRSPREASKPAHQTQSV